MAVACTRMCVTPPLWPPWGREYGSVRQGCTSCALVHYCMLIGPAWASLAQEELSGRRGFSVSDLSDCSHLQSQVYYAHKWQHGPIYHWSCGQDLTLYQYTQGKRHCVENESESGQAALNRWKPKHPASHWTKPIQSDILQVAHNFASPLLNSPS